MSIGSKELREEDPVDPRLGPELRATDRDLETGLRGQLGEFVQQCARSQSHSEGQSESELEKRRKSSSSDGTRHDVVYVEFEENDPRNPMSMSRRRKWIITIDACLFTVLSAAASTTYNQGFPSMTRDLNCSTFQATLGLSAYCIGFAVTPLVTASFSEEFGRMPIYIASSIGFMLSHVMIALAPNVQTAIVGRLFSGAFGSTGATMVGGSIADIWPTNERGIPMSIYSLSAVASVGIGAVAAGWVEADPRFQWRWIQWFHVIASGLYVISILICMRETRSAVILTRLARKRRRETGDNRYRARVEDERGSLRALIWISCTRPLYLLLTEPVVISFSVWLGFAWGVLYGIIDSIGPIFRDLHHFSTGAVGTAYISISIGAFLGLGTHFYQERLYSKNVAKRGTEARLYGACAAAFLFPAGMFVYAWCAFPSVPWIGLTIGITMFMWACFTMYLAGFTYLADVYGPFASSALAGQSLFRNIMAAIFPLFAIQMYDALTYKWANTLMALLATIMAPVPFVLFRYGPQLRARSKFASQVISK